MWEQGHTGTVASVTLPVDPTCSHKLDPMCPHHGHLKGRVSAKSQKALGEGSGSPSRDGDLCEFKVTLVYRASSRTGSKATEKPCLKKYKTKQKTLGLTTDLARLPVWASLCSRKT